MNKPGRWTALLFKSLFSDNSLGVFEHIRRLSRGERWSFWECIWSNFLAEPNKCVKLEKKWVRSLENGMMVDKLFDKITDWKGEKAQTKRLNHRNLELKGWHLTNLKMSLVTWKRGIESKDTGCKNSLTSHTLELLLPEKYRTIFCICLLLQIYSTLVRNVFNSQSAHHPVTG